MKPKTRITGITVLIQVLGIAIFILILIQPLSSAEITNDDNAMIIITNTSTTPGDTATASIMILNATDVDTVDLSLTYDQSVLNVINVLDGDFDTTIPNLEKNTMGSIRIGTFQTYNPGLSGDILIGNIEIKAVGNSGQTGLLKIIMNELKTPQGVDIECTVRNGTFSITQSDTSGGSSGRSGGGIDGGFTGETTDNVSVSEAGGEGIVQEPVSNIDETPQIDKTPQEVPVEKNRSILVPGILLLLIILMIGAKLIKRK